MKITYKIIVSIFILISVFAQNVIYASMADYTDEQADNRQKQEQQEWKKEQEERMNKSSNNFLKNLIIKKYDIIPVFDKQTLNYKIEKEITDNYLEISAETDDEKATVSGTGKIELQYGENNLRIDVTADNGTVRTYIINAKCIAKEEETKTEEVITEETKENIEPLEDRITQIQGEDAEKKMYLKNNIIVILVSALLIIIIVILKKRSGKKNGKHKI